MEKRRQWFGGCVLILFFTLQSLGQEIDFENMLLQDLMNIEVNTSSKLTETVKNAHANITVIPREEIEVWKPGSIREIINHIGGLYLSNDRNYSYIGVSGFSRSSDYNNRILFMVDNHVINENTYGSALIGGELGFDLNLIEQIEIIKGPGSALYGNNAMIGVINVITNKSLSKAHHQVNIETGSHGLFSSSASSKGKNYLIGLKHQKSNGEDFYFPELDQEDFNYGISKGLDYESSWNGYGHFAIGELQFSGMASVREKGIPTGAWETDLKGDSHSHDTRSFFAVNYTHKMSKSTLKLKSSADYYRYSGEYAYNGEMSADSSINLWAKIGLDYIYEFSANQNVLIGSEFLRNFRNDYLELYKQNSTFYKNNPSQNISFYAQYNATLGRLIHLLAGARYDWYQDNANSFSPRISLIYHPNTKLNNKLSYNRAFRAPNFYEMFYESVDSNIGNKDLKHETIHYLDFNSDYNLSKHIIIGIDAYLYFMEDLIDPVEGIDGIVQHQNFALAEGKGIGAYTRLQLNNTLNIKLAYNLQYLKISNQDKVFIPSNNTPKHLIKASLNYYIPNVAGIHVFNHFETGRKTLQGNKTEDQLITDLVIQSKSFFNSLKFNIKISNLFDTRYYHPAGYEHSIDMIIQPRRTVAFGVKYELKYK